jgi:hypothetical protein
MMTRTRIRFPEPLYQRFKKIAECQDQSLSEVMRKAAEHFVTRFPTIDCGGDFLTDPASLRPEVDAIPVLTNGPTGAASRAGFR